MIWAKLIRLQLPDVAKSGHYVAKLRKGINNLVECYKDSYGALLILSRIWGASYSTLRQQGKHLITKLRSDADLYYLWQGCRQPKQRGSSRKYAGKVNLEDLASWSHMGEDIIYDYLQLYAQWLYSKRYHRSLLVVLMRNTKTNKYVFPASTDLQQDPQQVVQYYWIIWLLEKG